MATPPLGNSTPMASDRASYTAEDVLDLLHDVEANIRERDGHFAASVSTGKVSSPVAPTDNMQHSRIRLPQHFSRVPVPPITGSREEWPPPRHSNAAQAMSTGGPKRPRVRLPQYAPRIQASPVTGSTEERPSSTSNVERTHVSLPQDLRSHLSPLHGDQSNSRPCMSANEKANIFDLPQTGPEENISELSTCEQENLPNTPSPYHAASMKVGHQPCSTLTGYATAVTPDGSQNKRSRADLWDDGDNERRQHVSKRVKLTSQTSAPATPARQEVVYNSFSEPPYQSSLLDWNVFEMGTPSPSERFGLDNHWLSSGSPTMLHSNDMDIDPRETPTLMQQVTCKPDKALEQGRYMSYNILPEETARCLPPHSRSQSAGDLQSYTNSSKMRLGKDIDGNLKLPERSVGLSDLPDDLQDRIFTILLKSEDEITLNTSWLMTFVNSAAHGPSVLKNVADPRQRPALKSASVLRSDLRRMNASLQCIPDDKWPRKLAKSQTSVLTRSLLTVSKAVHDRAARIFYGSNTFNFPHPKTCWMHLESLLATIGSNNASHIRHLRLHAPLWHVGVRRDAIIGALFDAMSPVTRLAAFSVPAEDRLLSAIKTCAEVLGETGNLKSLQFDVLYQDNALPFINQYQDRQFPILPDEVAHHDTRRDVGVQILRRWSTLFGSANRPKLVVHASTSVSPSEVARFRKLLAPMIREADKYGWTVDQILREPGRTVYRVQRV